MSTPAPYAWQQLTELVAATVGVKVRYHEGDDVYRCTGDHRLPNGRRFDPVRDDGEAARLAIAAGIRVTPGDHLVVASFRDEHGGELMVAEYDVANDGDHMKSYRLAVCRAILQQAEALKHA